MDTNTAMLNIMALDNDAKIIFSEYTNKWYVAARIEQGGDGFLTGLVTHQDTPDEAVDAYFADLCAVSKPLYLVTDISFGRKCWRWDGTEFIQIVP